MSDDSLPPELAELERQLIAVGRSDPAVDLRTRVLGGVRAELRREQQRQTWHYAAALAASALLPVSVSVMMSLM